MRNNQHKFFVVCCTTTTTTRGLTYLTWSSRNNYVLTDLARAYIRQGFVDKAQAKRFIKNAKVNGETYLYNAKKDKIEIRKLASLKFKVIEVKATFTVCPKK